jgi:hypothetical protein
VNPGDTPLAGELRDLLRRVDPVPAEVVAAARDSFGWRALDAELARLVADSRLAAAGVRGEPARLLSYQAGERTIEIEVTNLAGRLRVLGQLVPPQPARVRVEQPAGTVEVVADRWGRFAVPDLPPGPTRFACQPLGPAGEPVGTALVSEWRVL